MTGRTIVAIDDDKIILKIIESSLTKEGYTAHTYTNPVEAIKQIKDLQPDAILLDRIMPEMDGNDVIAALQNDDYTRNIPIIMLTALGDVSSITASLGLGARDYIVKPFDHDNLIIRLKKMLGTI